MQHIILNILVIIMFERAALFIADFCYLRDQMSGDKLEYTCLPINSKQKLQKLPAIELNTSHMVTNSKYE